MILIAVIVGYILGIAPFAVPRILEMKNNKVNEQINEEEKKTQAEIFNEWLNGPQKKDKDSEVNQEDIYNEYITGKESTKGD